MSLRMDLLDSHMADRICLVLSPFMGPSLIYAILETLSSCNLVALPLMEGSL